MQNIYADYYSYYLIININHGFMKKIIIKKKKTAVDTTRISNHHTNFLHSKVLQFGGKKKDLQLLNYRI